MGALRNIHIVLVVVAGAACSGGDRTIDMAHDPCAPLALATSSASDLQLAGIASAIELWRGQGVNALSSGDALGAGIVPLIDVRFEDAAPAFHGAYDDEHGVIYINETLADAQLPIVVAHELGHAFGLVHVSDRPSLMNPGNVTTPPNESDRQALAGLWGTCDAP